MFHGFIQKITLAQLFLRHGVVLAETSVDLILFIYSREHYM